MKAGISAVPTRISAPPVRLSSVEFADAVHSLQPKVAVFDCDGTLWAGDAGFGFMIWSIETGLLSRETADWIDSRHRSYRKGDVSEHTICAEMTQVYKGLREEEVRHSAAEYFRLNIEPNIFPEMMSLVQDLNRAGTEIWAVSSTNNWVIEEGVTRFNIPPSRVLAACVQIHSGTISGEIIDVPTGEGKAMALRSVGLPHPDAVFGNSIHDAAMMELAIRAFPVNPSQALAEISATRNWPVFYPAAVLEDRTK
ncbi:MAG: HAD family hydrolase [Acidobacteriaceae bacterium]